MLVHTNPLLTGQVGKLLGERWKALSDVQRRPYEEKAEADKKRYEEEKANYNVSYLSRLPTSNTPALHPMEKKKKKDEENHALDKIPTEIYFHPSDAD